MSNKIDRMTLFQDFDIFWNKESQYTSQTYITTDTRGIIVDYLEQALKTFDAEEKSRIKTVIEEEDGIDFTGIQLNKYSIVEIKEMLLKALGYENI